eukprot:362672-Chlamydomonas_euryale.AAC.2
MQWGHVSSLSLRLISHGCTAQTAAAQRGAPASPIPAVLLVPTAPPLPATLSSTDAPPLPALPPITAAPPLTAPPPVTAAPPPLASLPVSTATPPLAAPPTTAAHGRHRRAAHHLYAARRRGTIRHGCAVCASSLQLAAVPWRGPGRGDAHGRLLELAPEGRQGPHRRPQARPWLLEHQPHAAGGGAVPRAAGEAAQGVCVGGGGTPAACCWGRAVPVLQEKQLKVCVCGGGGSTSRMLLGAGWGLALNEQKLKLLVVASGREGQGRVASCAGQGGEMPG